MLYRSVLLLFFLGCCFPFGSLNRSFLFDIENRSFVFFSSFFVDRFCLFVPLGRAFLFRLDGRSFLSCVEDCSFRF